MLYSETSSSGPSKKQITSVQWTKPVPPIAIPIEIIRLEPLRRGHLVTPDNGQQVCPQRTVVCTRIPPRAADRDIETADKIRDN